MKQQELEKILKKEKLEFIDNIDYNKRKYIKALKIVKHEPIYIYYEIKEEGIEEVKNINLLNFFKEQYEMQPNSILKEE